MLSNKEKLVRNWYDRNAYQWAKQRKKLAEPSFWTQEYEIFQSLQPSAGKLLEIGSGSGREATEFIRVGYNYFGIEPNNPWCPVKLKVR